MTEFLYALRELRNLITANGDDQELLFCDNGNMFCALAQADTRECEDVDPRVIISYVIVPPAKILH